MAMLNYVFFLAVAFLFFVLLIYSAELLREIKPIENNSVEKKILKKFCFFFIFFQLYKKENKEVFRQQKKFLPRT